MPFRVGLSPAFSHFFASLSLSFPLAPFLFDPGTSQLDLDRDQLARDRLLLRNDKVNGCVGRARLSLSEIACPFGSGVHGEA